MSRAEQVERVLGATITSVHSDGSTFVFPLIEPGELWLPSEESVVSLVRRILAAAEGTTDNFIQISKPPVVRYHARRKRNLVAHEAYKNRKKGSPRP